MNIEQSAIGRIAIPPNIPAGFGLFWTTTDFDGRLDDETAQQIRGVMRERFDVDAPLTTCTQVHSATVLRAPRIVRWTECDACDALWSTERPAMLGIKIADCLPVSIIDPGRHVIANIHSGWRGTAKRITAAAIDTIDRETMFDAARALAWLGPSIRACCFEVGEEVVDQMRASYQYAEKFVDRSRAKPHVDVPGLTVALLQKRGFAPERIFDSGLCTRCGDAPLFHSFRRDPKRGGRNLAILAQR